MKNSQQHLGNEANLATFSLSHDVIFLMVSPLLGSFLVSFNCSLWSAVSSLQSAVCSLRSAVCSLQSAVCGLRSAVCGLQSANVIHRVTEVELYSIEIFVRGGKIEQNRRRTREKNNLFLRYCSQ